MTAARHPICRNCGNVSIWIADGLCPYCRNSGVTATARRSAPVVPKHAKAGSFAWELWERRRKRDDLIERQIKKGL
ncbi:MAG: hypothetical protein M0R06_16255 [Sphaerochaeta sp.]|jgi:hypothetical protein|nr:hypothetical protein [Sphaerochaeta sp.]